MSTDQAAPKHWWNRLSLRTRLVAVVCTTVSVALALSGVASLLVLRSVLIDQKDRELRAALTDEGFRQLLTSGGSDRPNPYYILIRDPDGTVVKQEVPQADQSAAAPEADAVSQQPLLAHEHTGALQGWTIGAADGKGEWRIMADTKRVPTGDGPRDIVVYLGLPLDDVGRVLGLLALGLLALAAIALPLAALGGGWAVRRSLRPLRKVEDVSTAFAAGDTTRRVPHAWPGTEVGALGSSVNSMLDQIEAELAARQAAQERMRRFVGDASHELRTPLAAVRGFAELYRIGAVSSPQEVGTTMRRIEEESKRMGGLVADLLLLARMDEQRPMQRQPVDVAALTLDASSDAHALAPGRTITPPGGQDLEEGQGPGNGQAHPIWVTGDEAHLRQVITNLMANAIRHTPTGSPIEFDVATVDGHAVLRVIDHGPGISADHANKVFERFYRADASRSRASGGSGLGLSIAEAIVTAHGGTIHVEPTPGGGATFQVRLPLAAEEGPHIPSKSSV